MGKNFLGLDGLKHFWSKAKIWIIDRITTEVTAKIAEIVANAPEDLDTLKEIADWISSHANDAAAMNAEIKANTEAISGKADKNHTHIKSDITDFPTSLPANGGTADYANKIEPNYISKTLTTVTSVTTKYIKVADCTWNQTGTLQVHLFGNNFEDTLVINFGGGNSLSPTLCGNYNSNSHGVYSVIVQKGSTWGSNYSIYVKVRQLTDCNVGVALLKGGCTINITESTTAPTNISEWAVSDGFFGTLTGNVTGNLTGNAKTATSASKLTTARKTYVTLGTASTTTTRDWSGDTTIPVSGTLAVANGGTGVTTQADINKAFISNLEVGNSGVTDGTEFVSSFASDKGFAESNALNKPYKRQFINVWSYIKDKISSVLGLTQDNYGGKARTAGTADKTVNDITINIPFVKESGWYVIPLGNIPEPTSTAIDSPYNWDITGFFSIIRSTGHNGSHIRFEAGHGYSHDWTTYAYLDKMEFRNVTASIKAFQYEGKWWLGLCIYAPNQGYTSKMTITYSRGLPATPTCILYNSVSGGVANEEINNSIQDIPSSWWRQRTICNPTTFTGNITAPSIKATTNFIGDLTGNSATATTADKATNDGNGNDIVNTYATKTALDNKANVANTNYKTSIIFYGKRNGRYVKIGSIPVSSGSVSYAALDIDIFSMSPVSNFPVGSINLNMSSGSHSTGFNINGYSSIPLNDLTNNNYPHIVVEKTSTDYILYVDSTYSYLSLAVTEGLCTKYTRGNFEEVSTLSGTVVYDSTVDNQIILVNGSADKAVSVVDYGDVSSTVKIGFHGPDLTADEVGYIAGYKADTSGYIKDVSKDVLQEWAGIGSLSSLNTTDKSNLVSAINEVWSGLGGNLGLTTDEMGIKWYSSNITSGSYNSPYYANGIWVIGSSHSGSGIAYSTDGKTWTSSNITSGYYNSPYYANGIWVIGSRNNSGIKYSIDGKTWTSSNITSGNYESPYYANGIWVIGGDGIKYSIDGKTWTSSNITRGYFPAPYYANGIWVVGSYANYGITYSTDGKTWTSSNISGYYNSPYYANGIWVIGSSNSVNGIKYSIDGKTWYSSNITSGSYTAPYYANGIWVIGGHDSGITYSTDGKTWTSSNITSGNYESPYYANGIWVIGSSNNSGIAYSTDGKTWTSSNITSGYYNSPYYANGIWVIGGRDSDSGIKYSTFNSLNDLGSAFKGISELKSYVDSLFNQIIH